VSAKTDPGAVWRCGPGRATVAPDDGRRGRVWVWGACEPATGLATTRCRPRRDRASCMQLLVQGLPTSPAPAWGLMTDHLRTPLWRETPVARLAWPEVTVWCIPQEAGGLNLREPWWKPWRSRALQGRRVERLDEVIEAILEATVYGHAHRDPSVWKKAA
jgi:DDE superfamily endonuclease